MDELERFVSRTQGPPVISPVSTEMDCSKKNDIINGTETGTTRA